MARNKDVTFIRHKGRIIPIRKKIREVEDFGFEGSRQTIEVATRKGDSIKIRKAPRFVRNLGKPDFDRPKARKLIKAEIQSIGQEVKLAQKGRGDLIFSSDMKSATRIGVKSTFPKEFGAIGAKSKEDFAKIAARGKGIRFGKLRIQAIERLSKGFSNEQGFDEPSKEFLLASRQIFDNKNVIFRKIGGKVRPIKVALSERHDLKEEAPF